MRTKFCHGISDINDTYAAFVIDQWGVLHNGAKAYDGVAETLEELKVRGKTVIILSNSGRRAEVNIANLEKMGITRGMYDEILTSGEMTFRGLRDQNTEPFRGLGHDCYLVSRGDDRSLLEGLDNVRVVDEVDAADFLLFSTTDAPDKNLQDYEPMLRAAVRRGLPALCANPDSRVLFGTMNVMGVGTLARRYRDFGGVVYYIGKPHKPIYNWCFSLLREKDIYPAQTVMIGDSMTHDILGGHSAGIDTCLVKGGLHAPHFKNAETLADVDRALDMLCAQYNNVHPHYLCHRFVWGKPLPDRKNKAKASAKKA